MRRAETFFVQVYYLFDTFVANSTPKTGGGLTESEWDTLCFDRSVGFSLKSSQD